MLDTLLYSNKPSKEKLDTLKNVYNITISDSIIEEVNTMCNLGEGIYERAVAEEQARQAIETEKLLKEMETEKNKKIQELIAAGLDPDIVKRIMSN